MLLAFFVHSLLLPHSPSSFLIVLQARKLETAIKKDDKRSKDSLSRADELAAGLDDLQRAVGQAEARKASEEAALDEVSLLLLSKHFVPALAVSRHADGDPTVGQTFVISSRSKESESEYATAPIFSFFKACYERLCITLACFRTNQRYRFRYV